jgi:hypothetical protein
MGYTVCDLCGEKGHFTNDCPNPGPVQRPKNLLCAAFVPRDIGLDWAEGRLTDLQIWKSDLAGTGECLFVAEIENPETWRELAHLMREIPPKQICFRSCVPSIVKRAAKFGARITYSDPGERHRYFGDGLPLLNFLSSMRAV